ncbi:hypothetical protein Pcinc_035068 [Petrolisthes cinctipes]|uniref:Uncharacterized protein n=1 Tax=Petrolisthes cinctipes TaxID=88211 RepID=A0AAE1EPK5_PETCI|nr:hypothetical protein Pcinc_035068 [Petrolisthes cinctipes]
MRKCDGAGEEEGNVWVMIISVHGRNDRNRCGIDAESIYRGRERSWGRGGEEAGREEMWGSGVESGDGDCNEGFVYATPDSDNFDRLLRSPSTPACWVHASSGTSSKPTPQSSSHQPSYLPSSLGQPTHTHASTNHLNTKHHQPVPTSKTSTTSTKTLNYNISLITTHRITHNSNHNITHSLTQPTQKASSSITLCPHHNTTL